MEKNTFANICLYRTLNGECLQLLCSLGVDEWTLQQNDRADSMSEYLAWKPRLAISMISTITLERSKMIFSAVLNGTADLSTNTSRFTPVFLFSQLYRAH